MGKLNNDYYRVKLALAEAIQSATCWYEVERLCAALAVANREYRQTKASAERCIAENSAPSDAVEVRGDG